jgi:hypothetical protein
MGLRKLFSRRKIGMVTKTGILAVCVFAIMSISVPMIIKSLDNDDDLNIEAPYVVLKVEQKDEDQQVVYRSLNETKSLALVQYYQYREFSPDLSVKTEKWESRTRWWGDVLFKLYCQERIRFNGILIDASQEYPLYEEAWYVVRSWNQQDLTFGGDLLIKQGKQQVVLGINQDLKDPDNIVWIQDTLSQLIN